MNEYTINCKLLAGQSCSEFNLIIAAYDVPCAVDKAFYKLKKAFPDCHRAMWKFTIKH